MERDELITSREYWITKIQLDLYNQVEQYMKDHELSRTQLANQLNVTKGYISQLLNGDFDHKISKLVDLALVMGKAPQINYVDLQDVISQENQGHKNDLFPFEKIIRGDQIQTLDYQRNEELMHIKAQSTQLRNA
ncbi:hypothetical protein GCM10028807_29000 [Spirosoma daeguense]